MTLHTDRGIPSALRRNHWMNQVATHGAMKPDEPAFKFQGEVTTWRQATERMLAFAAALERRGVSFGDRVVLLTLNRTETMLAILGITQLGAIAVPVNIRLTAPEIAFIVDDADADVLVVDEALAGFVDAVAEVTDRIRRVIVIGAAGAGHEAWADLIAEDLEGFTPTDVPEESTCLIMYTAGTTGRPKGAMLDHVNLAAQAFTTVTTNNVTGGEDVSLLTAPLFHIAGLGSLPPSLMRGTLTVIHPLGAFNAAEMLDAWERERITSAFNVPQQWQLICADPTVTERDLRLRVISWGAAPASDTLLRRMAEVFPDALIVAAFGQTELSPVTCVLRGEDSLRKLGSVGTPIPTMQYRVVDDDMRDVPRGEVGEIVYRGPNLMQGYWRNPEGTAAAFAGGWFHSGDLVRQDDEGFVWVVDRKKDMIITGGENVYCAEVENVLAAHPHIVEAALYGRPDERWGEIPVAAAALATGASLTLAQLRASLEGRLARFKQPKDLVLLDALPRNAAGKVNKIALRAADRDRVAGQQRSTAP